MSAPGGALITRFAEKVVVVTGAASGIGFAIAERFAKEDARVVIADVDLAHAEAAAEGLCRSGCHVRAAHVDVSDPASIERLFEGVDSVEGGLDVLVNNAGIAIAAPLMEYTLADWERQFRVNVTGTFLALREAAARMIDQGYGRIVNIASTTAFVSSTVPEVAYDASKAAVRQMTVSAAAELAPHGIRVNAVAPGTTLTALSRGVLDGAEAQRRVAEMLPVGRIGRPEDIAGAVLFLASDDADYICGHTILVDGGRLLY